MARVGPRCGGGTVSHGGLFAKVSTVLSQVTGWGSGVGNSGLGVMGVTDQAAGIVSQFGAGDTNCPLVVASVLAMPPSALPFSVSRCTREGPRDPATSPGWILRWVGVLEGPVRE